MPYFVHTKGCVFQSENTVDDDSWPSVTWTYTRPADDMRDFDYVDIVDEPTADFRRATTAKEAHSYKTDYRSIVVFHETGSERSPWRRRESQRLSGSRSDGDARMACPWEDDDWYESSAVTGTPSLRYRHHAYISIVHAGMVGYTPSEEYGVTDRQLVIRPGKYLEKFAPHLTQAERDEYIAQIKALQASNVVLFASDADAIEDVYRRGPNSCMSHALDDYASHIHPVRVYGDSDFDIAYLERDGRIRARAIVWRAKKLVGRVYGDSTLLHLLKQDGYTKVEDMLGARITPVHYGDKRSRVFVLPYMDVCTSVHYDGKNLITSDDDPDGYDFFDAQTTNGLTDDSIVNDTDHECANCDTMISEDDTLCGSCERNHYCCAKCDGDYYDGESQYVSNVGSVCESCYEDMTSSCEKCGNTFIEDAYSRTDRRHRSNEDLTDFCLDCGVLIEDERNAENEHESDDTDDGINETEDEKSPF